MMSTIYDLYETSSNYEQDGIKYEDGPIRLTLARAGGSNTKFAKTFEKITKPHRKAMEANLMPEAKVRELFYTLYAKAVVLGWETDVNAVARFKYSGDEDPYEKFPVKYENGIQARDGSILPFNEDNIVATFKALPELFNRVRAVAEDYAVFRANIEEEEAKN